jgi:hypothetical protein
MHFTGDMRPSHFSTNISRYGWMVGHSDRTPFFSPMYVWAVARPELQFQNHSREADLPLLTNGFGNLPSVPGFSAF